jgi:hypothetical protein
MENAVNPKSSAYLMIVAGCMFFVAAVIGSVVGQFALLAFFGVGGVFLALGASQLKKLNQPKS